MSMYHHARPSMAVSLSELSERYQVATSTCDLKTGTRLLCNVAASIKY